MENFEKIIKYEFEDGTVVNITVKAILMMNKTLEENKHQKKVIDRLSRKIQELKKITGIIGNSLDSKNEELTKYKKLHSKAVKQHLKKDEEIEFLRKRENKLQQIEQMFKNRIVDLSELEKIVRGGK